MHCIRRSGSDEYDAAVIVEAEPDLGQPVGQLSPASV